MVLFKKGQKAGGRAGFFLSFLMIGSQGRALVDRVLV